MITIRDGIHQLLPTLGSNLLLNTPTFESTAMPILHFYLINTLILDLINLTLSLGYVSQIFELQLSNIYSKILIFIQMFLLTINPYQPPVHF